MKKWNWKRGLYQLAQQPQYLNLQLTMVVIEVKACGEDYKRYKIHLDSIIKLQEDHILQPQTIQKLSDQEIKRFKKKLVCWK